MTPTPRKPSNRLTFDDAVEIWLMHWQGHFQSRIAARFDINQGRVSEVLNGKRWPDSRSEAAERRYRGDAA